MASWGSGDDGREVLAQGRDEPPRRLRNAVLVALLTAGVAGGVLVNSQDDGSAPPLPPAASTPPGSAAGIALPAATPVPLSRRELAGVWLVDKGPPAFSPGEMWMMFHLDGSFALDADEALLSDEPWVTGRYVLTGSDLSLVVEGGSGCRPGDRFEWKVGVLPDGHLWTRHLPTEGARCRTTPGVWWARPLRDTDMWRVQWKQ